MITTLFDTVGRWCVTWPWRVLALFGLLALGTIPLVSHLSLEADVRNMLPGEMAQTLERYHTLFGTSDLALLLVQTTQGRADDLIAFGTALQQQLAALAPHSPGGVRVRALAVDPAGGGGPGLCASLCPPGPARCLGPSAHA